MTPAFWIRTLDSWQLGLEPGNLRMPRFPDLLRRSDAKLVQEFLERDEESEERFLVAHPNRIGSRGTWHLKYWITWTAA